MKVRIIQSIDIEEIPDKLRELLDSTSQNMREIQGLFGECLSVSDINSDSPLKYNFLKQTIEKLRGEIASVDQELSDVDSILEGYIGIIEEPAALPPPAPVPAPKTQAPAQAPTGNEDANKG